MVIYIHYMVCRAGMCPLCPAKPVINFFDIIMTSWWAWWRLKSPASWLFTQPFIQTQIEENLKAPRHWPLCGEFPGEFPAQRASNAENVSIWWRHHGPLRTGFSIMFDILEKFNRYLFYDDCAGNNPVILSVCYNFVYVANHGHSFFIMNYCTVMINTLSNENVFFLLIIDVNDSTSCNGFIKSNLYPCPFKFQN